MKSDALIMASARGEECQIRIPFGCNFDRETTVMAHPNKPGKPKGGKLHAALGSYACSSCHDIYDRRAPIPRESHMTRTDVENCFWEGHARTFAILDEKGLL